MAYLVEESRRVDSFQEPLVRRRDLPRDLAKKLYWWVAAALRMKILENFDIHPSELDDAIVGAVTGLSEETEARDTKKPRATAANALAKAIAAEGKITGDLLINVLRRGEVPLFESLFGEMCGLETPTLERVLYDTGGEGLAIACSATGMNKQIFATIFMLTRARGRVLKPRDLSRAVKVFDSVDRHQAAEVLKAWRRDPDYQSAIMRLRAQAKRRGA